MSSKKLRKCLRKNLRKSEKFKAKKTQRRKLRHTKRKFTNVHHVIPQSRCQEFGVNPNSPRNKIVVDKKAHDLYHQLMGNKTPFEAFEYLLRTFWNGILFYPKKFQEGNFDE